MLSYITIKHVEINCQRSSTARFLHILLVLSKAQNPPFHFSCILNSDLSFPNPKNLTHKPIMACLKAINHFQILSSSNSTKPLSSDAKKAIFTNKSLNFNTKFSSKTSRHQLCLVPVKVVTKEEKDLVAAETSEKNGEDKAISGGGVKEKGRILSTLLEDKERLLNAAIVLGAGTLAITKLLSIDHEYWHVGSLEFSLSLSGCLLFFNAQFG